MNTREKLRKYEECRRDPYMFLRLVRTFDPLETDERLKRYGKPFPYKKEYIKKLVELWIRERYLYVLKSRQMLLTWLFTALYDWDTIVHPGQITFFRSEKLHHAGDFKQKLTLIWRAKFIIDHLPVDFLWHCWGKGKNEVESRGVPSPFINFPNGSTIVAISQDPDDIRSKTATGILDDETAFQPRYEESLRATMPSLGVVGRYTGITSINHKNYAYRVWNDIERVREDKENIVELV